MAEIRPFIDIASWLVRILWAIRVNVIYAVAGCLLFYGVIPAQNLMADLSSMTSPWAEFFFWAGVFFSTFMLWAFPIHYGARRTLQSDGWIIPRALRDDLPSHCQDYVVGPVRERYALMITWIPRFLGLMPFAALALGIHGALGALLGADALEATKTTRAQAHWLYVADGVTALIFVVFVYLRCRIIRSWIGPIRFFHVTALVLTTTIFLTAYVYPIFTSVHFPRALIVPPLFGSLVLLLSELQRWGNKTGFPFLLALFGSLGVLTGLNAGFNDLRILPKSNDERLTMAEAVTHWKKANHCEKGDCPRPIIVAIDGGASRAAFTAATFVGEFLDRMPKATDGEATTRGRRIFAISGVSGGSYGAAVIQSALADGQADGDAPPCRSAQSTWFGYPDWIGGDRRFGWRQCLQALTSGDYLSTTILGLAFRDFAAPAWQTIPLLHLPPMKDRAGLLEMSWERQYSATLQSETHFYEAGTDCDGDKPSGFCRPAAHPAAFFPKDGPPKWIPMLLLNGTSVGTGRRLISSDLASRRKQKDMMGASLYPQAYDLREVMAPECPNPPAATVLSTQTAKEFLAAASEAGDNKRTQHLGVCGVPTHADGPNVRLSTAALASARFPIVSPAGVFAMPDTPYGDQVVDGGYFENSGLTTALNIVSALRNTDADLNPMLVSIANDPEANVPSTVELEKCKSAPNSSLGDCSGLPRRPATTPLLLPADTSLVGRIFGILSRPLQTLLSTGNGHADEALGAAEAAFPAGGFYRLKVDVTPNLTRPAQVRAEDEQRCGQIWGKSLSMAKVSMSWWLSAAVQADLDAQRCSSDNRAVLDALLAVASQASAAPR